MGNLQEIKKDVSGGSNAITELVTSCEGNKVYRKTAVGNNILKLEEQVHWIRKHKDIIPVPEICGEGKECLQPKVPGMDEEICEYHYEMPYYEDAKLLSETILDDYYYAVKRYIPKVFKTLEPLYKDSEKVSEKTIEKYYEEKVEKNLERISDGLITLISREHFEAYETYKKLCKKLLNRQHFINIFKNDRVSEVHGDLTAENIVTREDGSIYFIDPNGGNILDSKWLDYGKFLQSVHGNYELIMKYGYNVKSDDYIKYSAAYNAFSEEFLETLTEEQMLMCYYHEIVHWLRLLPYKIKQNYKPMDFFLRLVDIMKYVATIEGVDID